jgi:tetratricopeptide (TPR) repeat protein
MYISCPFDDRRAIPYLLLARKLAESMVRREEAAVFKAQIGWGFATLHRRSDRWDDAALECKTVIELMQQSSWAGRVALLEDVYLNLGEALRELGKDVESLASFGKAYELVCGRDGPADPKLQLITQQMVINQSNIGELDKAETFARVAYQNMKTFGTPAAHDSHGATELADMCLSYAIALQENAVNEHNVEAKRTKLLEAERLCFEGADIMKAVEGPLQSDESLGVTAEILQELTRFLVRSQRLRKEHGEYFSRAVSAFVQVSVRMDPDDPDAPNAPCVIGSAMSVKARYHAFVARGLEGQHQDDDGGVTKEEQLQLARELQLKAEEIYRASTAEGASAEQSYTKCLRDDLDALATQLSRLCNPPPPHLLTNVH